MKTKKILKKLSVKKTTIANLDRHQMGGVIGGESRPCVETENSVGPLCIIIVITKTYYDSCHPLHACFPDNVKDDPIHVTI